MLTNFRKETSERSDATNWAKRILIENTPYHFDSIEGCNENNSNVATHLMERARVDYDGNDENMDIDAIRISILTLESEPVLQRKINFARAFRLNLTYVLYNDETQKVWMYEFENIENLKFVQQFDNFISFSNWIAQIKGWKSTKPFREIDDLPLFDKILRRAGTAWPTNIDCFISDEDNRPIAILEFQNANMISVKEHCNNEFFLCKQMYVDSGSNKIKYHDDIRRWLSQEILRVQSGLRFFIVTWDNDATDFALKEVYRVTFPELPFNLANKYKHDMHEYAVKKDRESGDKIKYGYQSYHLENSNGRIKKIIHNPPLSAREKSFPFIYYRNKWKILGRPLDLHKFFKSMVENDISFYLERADKK